MAGNKQYTKMKNMLELLKIYSRTTMTPIVVRL